VQLLSRPLAGAAAFTPGPRRTRSPSRRWPISSGPQMTRGSRSDRRRRGTRASTETVDHGPRWSAARMRGDTVGSKPMRSPRRPARQAGAMTTIGISSGADGRGALGGEHVQRERRWPRNEREPRDDDVGRRRNGRAASTGRQACAVTPVRQDAAVLVSVSGLHRVRTLERDGFAGGRYLRWSAGDVGRCSCLARVEQLAVLEARDVPHEQHVHRAGELARQAEGSRQHGQTTQPTRPTRSRCQGQVCR
jgi:hypothetical protein